MIGIVRSFHLLVLEPILGKKWPCTAKRTSRPDESSKQTIWLRIVTGSRKLNLPHLIWAPLLESIKNTEGVLRVGAAFKQVAPMDVWSEWTRRNIRPSRDHVALSASFPETAVCLRKEKRETIGCEHFQERLGFNSSFSAIYILTSLEPQVYIVLSVKLYHPITLIISWLFLSLRSCW